MTRSPTILWCPNCEECRPCRSLNPSDVGEDSGHTFYKVDHEDLQYFRRFRRCVEYGHDFETVEMEVKFLDELVKLRTSLAGIKLNAAAYEEDAKKTAETLDKLSTSLAVSKALG